VGFGRLRASMHPSLLGSFISKYSLVPARVQWFWLFHILRYNNPSLTP
jgi:hypothetical protein